MPKARNPNQDKAFEIYKEHNGNITNRAIAELLGEDEKIIAVWKSRNKWNVVQQTEQCCTTKKKGGQPGNKNALGHGAPQQNRNAVGNSGGAPEQNKNALGYGAPKQNKNAVTTGEFETLFFDCLEPDEQEMIEQITLDKNQLLLQEIQLLTVRERRMLKRIEALKRTQKEQNGEAQGMTAVKYKTGVEKDKETDLFEYAGILGQIQAIENALTRVQASKQRAIDSLHRYGYDDARLKLELKKYDSSDDEIKDDGFIDALNGKASEDWEDEDSSV